MSIGSSEEIRFYINLAKNNWFGQKYDLNKVPGPPGYRIAGHIPHMMRPDYHIQALEWANKYGGICKFSLGGQYIILVSDPQLVQQILGRGPGSLPRKCIGYQYFDLATNHLGRRSFFTTTDEDQWQLIRKGCAQAFSQANIRRYFTCALKHAQGLAEQVKITAKRSKAGCVEMQEQVEMMLLDVFLEGLFEMDLRRVNSEEIGHAMNLVLEEANERIKFPLRKLFINAVNPRWGWKVWHAQHVLGGLYERIYDTIRSRGVPPAEETVLWACLARLKDPATDKPLTKEQLLPEIGAFILAGFDTSSHTIAWCLFNIAAHPDVQMKIKNELSATGLLHQGQANCVTPRQLAHEDLPRLPYLNAVIDETMRMYPVAATGSVRETTAPTQVGPYKIPEGIVVWPMIYALQNSVQNWEDPDKFVPERWLDNRDCAYVSSSSEVGSTDTDKRVRRFAPFSDGLKNCLGQALGLMEVRTVLATLLSRFWFEMAPSMGKPEQVKKNQQIALTLKMKEGLSLIALLHEEAPSRLKPAKSGGTWAARAIAAAARAPSGPLN
eukprot:GHUV01000725.1.p1 GENE.GHUV01000725.1~~GHUV01000725.1.p1  ORF type:complete len:552 (+),score=175.13 GHUV01000725.1:213-1868(+)